MADTDQTPSGNGKNPFEKKDYDIMDPEAKVGGNEKKSIQDRVNDAKEAVNKMQKTIKSIQSLAALGPVLLIILVIIIIIGIVGYFTSLPGLMIEKLKDIASSAINIAQSWFTTQADAYIDEENIVDLANYLEEMEYDLVGYGFVEVNLDNMDYISSSLGYITYTEVRELGYTYYETRTENGDTSPRYYNEDGQAYGESDEESGYYYNSLGILIDNSDGEIATMHDNDTEGWLADMWDGLTGFIRGATGGGDYSYDNVYMDKYGILRSSEEYAISGEGVIENLSNVDTKLLRSYLLSDYKITVLRNDDDSILNTLWANIKSTFGGYDAAWAKGLIKLYISENGIATRVYGKADGINTIIDAFVENWIDSITIDGDTLSIKEGIFNNAMEYNIEGWADRYGMSLEFLLSLHLATMAPDLVYAMLQSFDTEVQVYLNDADGDETGGATVESLYVEISDEDASIDDGITLDDIVAALREGNYDIAAEIANLFGDIDALDDLVSLGINKKNAQYLLTYDELGLESPPNCLGEAVDYVILDSSYSDSYDLQTYNLTESVDSEIYAEFDEYTSEETISVVENGKEFTLENVSQSIGTDDNEYLEEDYTLLTDSAESYGYDEDTAEIEEIGEPDVFETKRTKGIDTSKYYIYKHYRVKQYRTWTAEVDGEEVEFEWITYKYLVYEVGTQKIYNYATEYETTEDIVYYDTEQWVDTIMVEFIVREKTLDELVDAGLLTYDEDTGEYTSVDPSETRCSDEENRTKCCKNCRDYVRKVILALADVQDSNYQTSTPYIARVLGSWFRDTYFVIPEEEDVAITDYKNESTRSEAEEAMIDNSWGNSTLVTVDEEYLSDTGEYWTEYITDDDGDYVLFYMNPDGTYESTTENDYGFVTMDEFLSENDYSSQEAAEEDGHVFVKKAVTTTAEDVALNGVTLEGIVWSAYGFDDDGSSTGWIHIDRDDEDTSTNDYIQDVYDIFDEEDDWVNEDGGFYYNVSQTYTVTQTEDAQRSETNATVKWLFKYRKYYIYDGTEDKALQIAEDKEMVLEWAEQYLENNYSSKDVAELLGKYGRSALRQAYASFADDDLLSELLTLVGQTSLDMSELTEEWLEWQLDMYYSGITNGCDDKYIILTDEIGFIEETDDDGNITGLTMTTDLTQADRIGDPRDSDLINTINIDKTSLDAFSILENTQTLAAEYAYRDFKELIVELDYFDKEDLSDAIAEVFSWVIPDINEIGWPVRPYDKQDVDYGALIESAGTYEFLSEIGYDVTGDDEDTDEDSDEDSTDDDTTSDDTTGDTDDDTTDDTTDDSSTDEDETDESSSSSTSFTGYEGDEYVSSPITGKVVEIGTHTRTNVYTEEEETVGYIVIEAIETSQAFGGTNSSGEVTESYIKDYLYSEDDENAMTDTKEMAEALNLFYDEYEDTCAGYTVMIDGLNIEGATDTITDSSEIWSILSGLQDEEGNFGSYEQNEVVALYKSSEQEQREANEQAKDDAPYLVMVDGEVYVKEGKYIGKTYTDDEVATFTTEDEEGNEVTGPANYIRIILKDTDYTVIDDVEDYFDIPEPEVSGSSSGVYTDLESVTNDSSDQEKARAAMSYFIANGFTEEAAAGILGNLIAESNLDSTITNGTSYYGIAQWNTGTNGWWYDIQDWLIENGYNDTDFAGQVRAVYEADNTGQMTTQLWAELKELTNMDQATELFCVWYEACIDTDGYDGGDGYTQWYSTGTLYQGLTNRQRYAQNALDIYYGADIGLKD